MAVAADPIANRRPDPRLIREWRPILVMIPPPERLTPDHRYEPSVHGPGLRPTW